MAAKRLSKISSRIFLLGIVFVLIVGAVLYLRPLPDLQAVTTLKTNSTAGFSPAWPSFGETALGAEGYGVFATHGAQKTVPIASISKVMTAYSILQQKPLQLGEQGPTITMTEADVTTYNDYYAKGGSVAKVAAGEKISEYKALQAMLLPSANNMADSLAIWGFGSLPQYITYANNMAKSLGLQNTKIADASGFSPQTESTASDLVLLGEAALKNPVFAQIVSQQTAKVPVAGTLHNVNWLLGMDNVNGIKTGDTDAAGGCFLFSSKHNIAGHQVTIIGAVLSAPGLNRAITASRALLKSVDNGFGVSTFVKAGQEVGYYQVPWGGHVPVVAQNSVSLFTWKAAGAQLDAKFSNIHSGSPGNPAGSINVTSAGRTVSDPLILKQDIPKPSWKWRIFNR